MSLWNLNKTYTGDVPPKLTVGVYCGAGAFRDACYQLVSSFLLTYITLSGVLGPTPTDYLAQFGVISLIVVIYRIWDGLNDPIMGWIIEKVHFKWGKYKPWILIGGILNSVVVAVLFLWRPTGWGFVAMFAVFYFLWDIVFTVNDIAYWSMLPSFTKDEQRKNRITSIMEICISIGVFVVYALVPTLVGQEGTVAKDVYGVIATVIVILFALSQIAVCVFCKEHQRNAEDEAKEQEDVKFKDMFTIFKENDQFRINIIAILLNYLGSGVVVGFGMYYFYLMFGYGGDTGGAYQFIFTVMYAVGTLISQIAYSFIAKKLTRKQIYTIATIITAIGYLLLLVTGFPLFGTRPLADPNGANLMWLLYVSGFLLFFGQGVIAIAIIIQMQTTIEYNEWKTGKRKEAVASSMRALAAKLSGSIQQALIYGTLSASSLYVATQKISELENNCAANGITLTEAMKAELNATIQASISNWQMLVLAVGMIVIPLILIIVSSYLSTKVFKIDEKFYSKICSDLDERHKANA